MKYVPLGVTATDVDDRMANRVQDVHGLGVSFLVVRDHGSEQGAGDMDCIHIIQF